MRTLSAAALDKLDAANLKVMSHLSEFSELQELLEEWVRGRQDGTISSTDFDTGTVKIDTAQISILVDAISRSYTWEQLAYTTGRAAKAP